MSQADILRAEERNLAERLRLLRRELKLTGKEVGRRRGCSQLKWSKVENGCLRPSVDLVQCVADLFKANRQDTVAPVRLAIRLAKTSSAVRAVFVDSDDVHQSLRHFSTLTSSAVGKDPLAEFLRQLAAEPRWPVRDL